MKAIPIAACRAETVHRPRPQLPSHFSSAWILFLSVLLAAKMTPAARALSGLEGTFEFACDAPWRMEPSAGADGRVEYGAIPVQISIHDAMHAGLDNVSYPPALLAALPPANLPKELVGL